MYYQNFTNGNLSIAFYLNTVISLFICSQFIIYISVFFIALSNVCSVFALFFYVTVLARLS